MNDFMELTRKAQEAPVTVKGARDYTRFLFAGASEEKPDKQGRITITPMLREYAALTATWSSSASMNRIEIWDPPLARLHAGAGDEFAELERGGLPRV
jgi:MraZ protein